MKTSVFASIALPNNFASIKHHVLAVAVQQVTRNSGNFVIYRDRAKHF